MKVIASNDENVLITISEVKNAKGEFVTINVPTDYKGELDSERDPRLILNECDNILLRVGSIEEVLEIIKNNSIDVLHDAYEGRYEIYNQEYYDEELNDYRESSEEEVLSQVLTQFKLRGCVYQYIAYNFCPIDNETNMVIRLANKDAKIINDAAEVFTARYKVGTNCFYHVNSSEDLKASKIDTIVVTHKSGYNVTTEYVMKDGKKVSENNVLMKDKALEWVNSRG